MSDVQIQLAGMLVLAGSVRECPFERSVHRSLLNLPVAPKKDVFDVWAELAAEVAQLVSIPELPVRVVLASTSQIPMVRKTAGVAVSVETDPVELRGPGGVLADLAAHYGPDDALLVVSGNQLPIALLKDLAADVTSQRGDVVVWTHADGTPVTMYRIRAGVLSDTPGLGYLDFKEQVLPKLTQRHDVRVSRFAERSVVPIRTMKDYLAGLRCLYHGQAETHLSARLGRWDDPWQPAFGIVEHGASVAGSVDLFDAVVLSGARVEEHAVVIRSVVASGSVVPAGQTIFDELVAQPKIRPC